MARLKRLASSLLLAAGVVLVFAGLNAMLGFNLGSTLASVAVIAALLYAGTTWFAPGPPSIASAGGETVIVFDRSLHVTAGATPGTPLLTRFPAAIRDELETRCRAALRGEHSHFLCEIGGRRVAFDVAPVQTMAGAGLYGVLIVGSGTPVPAAAARPVTTVA